MEANTNLDRTTGNDMPSCPVCRQALSVELAHGRKSGKAFVMLRCPLDGRHFRGFISDREFVSGVLARLEKQQ